MNHLTMPLFKQETLHLYIAGFIFLLGNNAFAQSCNTDILASTPSDSFIVHNDGTATHLATGLMWKVCSEGQYYQDGLCNNTAIRVNWEAALQRPMIVNASAGFASYNNWRLPNIKELQSITEYQCVSPAINEAIFLNKPSYLWSSSPTLHYSDSSWAYAPSTGGETAAWRGNLFNVLLVRDIEN